MQDDVTRGKHNKKTKIMMTCMGWGTTDEDVTAPVVRPMRAIVPGCALKPAQHATCGLVNNAFRVERHACISCLKVQPHLKVYKAFSTTKVPGQI